MNLFSFPPPTSPVSFPAPSQSVPTPLERLAARIQRRAAVPDDYRFIANIAEADLERAILVVRFAAPNEELRLASPAVDDWGRPVAGAALYARRDMPEPSMFWRLFHAHDRSDAA